MAIEVVGSESSTQPVQVVEAKTVDNTQATGKVVDTVEHDESAREQPESVNGEEEDEFDLSALDGDGEADEEEDEEESDEEEEGDEEEQKPKSKKGGFQRRIDKLRRAADEQKREAEFWRQKALEAPGKSEAKQEEVTPPAKTKAPTLEDFDFDYAAYQEALVDWKVDQKLEKQQHKEYEDRVRQEAEKVSAEWNKKSEKASNRYSDFDVVRKTDLPLTEISKQVFLSSDVGPDMVYWLCKNPEKARQILTSAPVIMVKELGKLEDKISEKLKLGKAAPTKVSTASKEHKPVGAPKGKSAPAKTSDPEKMSQREFNAWREAQIKARNGR